MLSLWDRIQIAAAVRAGERDFYRELRNHRREEARRKKTEKDVCREESRTQTGLDADITTYSQDAGSGISEDEYHFDKESFLRERQCEAEECATVTSFAEDGFDRFGYDRFLYDRHGIDRSGKTREKYAKDYGYLCAAVCEAERKLREQEYNDALNRSRQVFEAVLSILLLHKLGAEASSYGKILDKQQACESYCLLGDDTEFIEGLHKVRKTCNRNSHEITYADTVSHNKVHAVVMTVKDLVGIMAQQLDLRPN